MSLKSEFRLWTSVALLLSLWTVILMVLPREDFRLFQGRKAYSEPSKALIVDSRELTLFR